MKLLCVCVTSLKYNSQPSIRGILTSCAGIAVMLGIFIVFLLGSIMTWRNVALICLSVPLVTVVAICFVSQLNIFNGPQMVIEIQIIALCIDSWNSYVAIIKESTERRSKISAMAKGMGASQKCRKRIRRHAKIQRLFEFVRILSENEIGVWSSSANVRTKTSRTHPKAKFKTVYFDAHMLCICATHRTRYVRMNCSLI